MIVCAFVLQNYIFLSTYTNL